jgi:hypothetical protein
LGCPVDTEIARLLKLLKHGLSDWVYIILEGRMENVKKLSDQMAQLMPIIALYPKQKEKCFVI